jgi:hypothetical protein
MNFMKIAYLAPVALALAAASAGCTTSNTVTAAICSDASALQASSVKLNGVQTTALQGIVTTCAATAGGTSFTNATLAVALINDAILLQSSGLLSDIHITAQAPEGQRVLERIKLHWAQFERGVK